jgi:hypothetical protein
MGRCVRGVKGHGVAVGAGQERRSEVFGTDVKVVGSRH